MKGTEMMKRTGLTLGVAALAISAWASLPQVKPQVEYFPLSAVRLTGGPLKAQQDLNHKYLLQLEPDRLLCNFRVEAGLDPKAPAYLGWDSETEKIPYSWKAVGHFPASYLIGAAMTYQATGDEELKKRLLYIVDELAEVQQATGGPVLAAWGSNRVLKEVAQGNIRVNGGSVNGINEILYVINRMLLGLHKIHLATGSRKARDVFFRFVDWFGEQVVDKLTDAQIQKLLISEHGSLPESFCDACLMSGDEKYARWARRLCEMAVVSPMAAGDRNFLDDRHANCTVPKFTACARVWRLTGEELFHRAAANAWDDITGRRAWTIGSLGCNEKFFKPEAFEKMMLWKKAVGSESCPSVNFLRLTEAIFQCSPEARRIDYYERSLFNHLLSNHDPERGMAVYNTAMRPGAYRFYSDQFDSMWCCTGTGLESPGKLGKMIYTRRADDTEVTVQLFAPSTLDWKSRGVKLRQETRFPYEEGTTLVVEAAPANVEFTLAVRHPAWVAEPGFSVTVNGERVPGQSKAGTYFAVTRKWNSGDRVRIALPMKLVFEKLPFSKRYGAFVYGPVVLAGELGRQGLIKPNFWRAHYSKLTPAREVVPFAPVATAAEALKMIRPVEGEPLHFRTAGFAPKDVNLSPFFEVHFQRYTIYWELKGPAPAASSRK